MLRVPRDLRRRARARGPLGARAARAALGPGRHVRLGSRERRAVVAAARALHRAGARRARVRDRLRARLPALAPDDRPARARLGATQVTTPTAFVGASSGTWAVERMVVVSGASLAPASHVSVVDGSDAGSTGQAAWLLPAVTSNNRYVRRADHDALAAREEQ